MPNVLSIVAVFILNIFTQYNYLNNRIKEKLKLHMDCAILE